MVTKRKVTIKNPDQFLKNASTEHIKTVIQAMELERSKTASDKFLSFVKKVWPNFIEGTHHRIIGEKLERIASGELKRLIVNMPPRHTKSEFASFLFPSWIIGKKPETKIIQTTHTAELSVNFGRKMKNLIDSDEFKQIFPKVSIAVDSKASGRWHTNHGGEYFAAGVGGAITGRGADLLIIDDPHSEQDALSATALDSVYEWYTSGPRQRLQPGGAIVVVMTRWSVKDLTGALLKAQSDKDADKWEVIEFPAIWDTGKAMWPEYWKVEELEKVKATLPAAKWNAQFQQNPTAEEGSIIKREWWKIWEKKKIPKLHYVIQSYDTAFGKSETADYSAITTWGVFYPTSHSGASIMLMDMKKGRWEFPELKRVAFEQFKYWEPEITLIEAKASGTPLTQELRKMGIPVINFTPSRGNDKHTRVNSVAPLFESGQVWRPDERWTEEVVEECASFPFGEHDDLVDSTVQALMRFRQGGFVEHPEDYADEPLERGGRKEYY